MPTPNNSSHQPAEQLAGQKRPQHSIRGVCRAILLAGAASVGGVALMSSGVAIAADTTDATTDAAADQTTENKLTEVVVSSDRLSSHEQLGSLHDTPKSIDIIGGADLASLNEVNITDVLRRLANVQFDYGNPRTGGVALRGVNGGTAAGDNVDPSVLTSVDGVSYVYAPLANGSDFFDIESVAITRGPGGTEGGYNSSLGVLEITTRKPTFTPEAEASITYGTHNSLLTEAAVGGPIIDGKLAFRAAFERDYADGEYENSFSEIAGRSSYVNTDRTQARIEFLWTPLDDLSALLIGDYQPKGNEYLNGLTFHLPGPATYANGAPINTSTTGQVKLLRSWFASDTSYTVADYFGEPVNQDNNGAITTGTGGLALTLDWKLPIGDLKAISAYRNHYFSAANDDGTPFDITDDGGYITYYHQFTQEVRLNSNSGGRVDWVAGLYYLDNWDSNISRSRYGSDAGAWNSSAAQYTALDATAAGQLLMENSQDRVYRGLAQTDSTESYAAFGHVDIHVTDPLVLGLGARISHQDRGIWESGEVLDQGFGAALNPVSINSVQLDGFNSTATGALAAGNSAAQSALANSVAQQYFGVATYSALSAAQQQQVAYAKQLRAQALGALFGSTTGTPYSAWLPSGEVSLRYNINDDVTPYVTYQRGVKSGATQINGTTSLVETYKMEPEKSNSFEVGVNNKLLGNTLIINGDIYLDNVYNFQQSITFYDPVATQLANTGQPVYTTANGNVPWVQLKGVELDAVYSGIDGLQLRLSGAYNDAIYKSYPYASYPYEDGNLPGTINPATGVAYPNYISLNGKTLPNAPKVRFDFDTSYHHDFFGGVAHGDADYNYQGRQNGDPSGSAYAWVGGYGLVNLALGWSTRNGGLDVSLVSKNAFQNRYHSANTATSWTPGYPAWYGIRVSSKLY